MSLPLSGPRRSRLSAAAQLILLLLVALAMLVPLTYDTVGTRV